MESKIISPKLMAIMIISTSTSSIRVHHIPDLDYQHLILFQILHKDQNMFDQLWKGFGQQCLHNCLTRIGKPCWWET
jgi:hypothetical protein